MRVGPVGQMPDFNATNMAAFSSVGPASDGRLKPDLAAPGDRVYSASSDGLPYSYQASTHTHPYSYQAGTHAHTHPSAAPSPLGLRA